MQFSFQSIPKTRKIYLDTLTDIIFYKIKLKNTLIFLLVHAIILMWVANSMVEYSAFNRIVLGSSPR